jgi:gentisate 1,2-dioxygenase
VKDPVRVEWKVGGVFVTPPGWWHSHHNDSTEDAWVLPLQVRSCDLPTCGLGFI